MFSASQPRTYQQVSDRLTESDIVGSVGIATIGVLEPTEESSSSLGIVLGSIDVVVFVQHIGRVDDDRSPELGLDNRPILDNHILRVCNRK